MNAVERVRKAFSEEHSACEIYTDCERSYLDALDDVQEELNKEVSYDWKVEIMQLRQKYECEIAELKKQHEYENKENTVFLECAKHERDFYKAK